MKLVISLAILIALIAIVTAEIASASQDKKKPLADHINEGINSVWSFIESKVGKNLTVPKWLKFDAEKWKTWKTEF